LKDQVKKLKQTLPDEKFEEHEIVKFAFRIRKADQEIIPENPNHRDYLLHGDLKKYRRYKKGLMRYRIMFCFSNSPKIILYLYINDEKHLRKEGSKTDPYEQFKSLVKKRQFSHNPSDINIQKWIKTNRP
ncbi:type II toxin-antitoxin system YhaV family toxin, partial [bacterium]|nr:type II toxin-antitoxin system YhaV family toxin [bacterium]